MLLAVYITEQRDTSNNIHIKSLFMIHRLHLAKIFLLFQLWETESDFETKTQT